LFQYLIELADATYGFYPLIFDGKRWKIDLAALEEAIDPLTRVIVLVNPNNPTGSYITSEELGEINHLCARHKIALISDEVFFDYRLNPDDREGVSLVNNSAVATYVLNGLSKNLALPQMKLSWIVTSGPKAEVDESLGRLEMIADTFLSVNTPVQNALPVWLSHRGQIQLEILKRVRHNYALAKDFALRHKIELCASQGGWYAVLKFPSLIDEEEWILDLLIRKHVLVHPGYFFDFEGEGFIVFSLLPTIERMTEGLSAISDVIRRKV
jgi:aspartate/methionine/tyrosine aminotransferase